MITIQLIESVMSQHYDRKIQFEDVPRLLGYQPERDLMIFFSILDDVIGQKDNSLFQDVVFAMGACGVWEANPVLELRYVHKLLLEDWHSLQEDFAFSLGFTRNPSSVPYLIKAIDMLIPAYDYQNGNEAYHRKCLYSLAKIGTSEAVTGIFELRHHHFSDVREAAEEVIEEYGLQKPA
jgi:hypothetical protein